MRCDVFIQHKYKYSKEFSLLFVLSWNYVRTFHFIFLILVQYFIVTCNCQRPTPSSKDSDETVGLLVK